MDVRGLAQRVSFKRKLIIFGFIFVIGSVLGIIGNVHFNSTANGVTYFWPGAVIQSVGGIFFGITGVIAGIIFPIFSNTICKVTLPTILIWTPANILQSFLPFLTKKIFKFDPCQFNKKTILCFIFGCAVIPHLLGALVGSLSYYFSHEIVSIGEYIWIVINWARSNILAAIAFGLLLLKFFLPALKECKIYDSMDSKAKA